MLCLAAYAKINWTLDILGTRPDGYHLMDMLMQTVSLCDLLWMEEAGGPHAGGRARRHGARGPFQYERRSFLRRGAL